MNLTASVLLSPGSGRIRPAACFAVCVCHIAIHTCHAAVCVCACHTAVCSMLMTTAISHYIYALHFLLLHIMLPLHFSSKSKMPSVLKQTSPVLCQRLPPQFVAMHDSCQQANCIANGSRCETLCQEKAPGVKQHAKVFMQHSVCSFRLVHAYQGARFRSLQAQSCVML